MQTKVLSFAFAIALFYSAGSVAQKSPFTVSFDIDGPILLCAATTALVTQSFQNAWVKSPCPCDKDSVNSFDRGVSGKRDDSLSFASDVLAGVGILAPLGLAGLDAGVFHGEDGALTDAIVIGETLLVNVAVNQIVKLSFQRPRPLAYQQTPPTDADSALSFYSAHTSTVFAAGVSFGRTHQLRHPDSAVANWIYAGTAVVGAAVGSLRVLSGRHFITDVLVGAVLGSAIGWTVPTLHRSQSTTVTLMPYSAMGLAAVVNFP